MPTKRVTVHYRRVCDRNFHDLAPDFRQCLEAGLGANIGGAVLRDTDTARITTSSDDKRMCLLEPVTNPNFSFGEIAVFRSGDLPVAETDAAGQVTLKTIQLGQNEEGVLGSSYFMVHGPHVALLHHESSSRFVQDYFRWILRQPLGPLAQDEMVHLMPLISVGGNPVGLRNVKSLTLRAEVTRGDVQPMPAIPRDGGAEPTTFRRTIERQLLTGGTARTLLRSLGLTPGTLQGMSDEDLADLEFELLVRKKEHNRLQPLPDELVEGVVADGLDRAAEFGTDGTRRRGNAVVASFPGEVELVGAYYDLTSARELLWEAIGAWSQQGLI